METPNRTHPGSCIGTFKTSLEEWKPAAQGVVTDTVFPFKTSLEEWKHQRRDRRYERHIIF